MEKDKLDTRISVIGQLIPREHDHGMFGIGIMTDEGPYNIEMNPASEPLLDFLYQDIRAMGVVRYGEGSKRIILEDYEVLD